MGEPIAIVGIGCRFPGGRDLPSYWKLLQQGSQVSSRASKNAELPIPRSALADSGRRNVLSQHSGQIENVQDFDWRSFQMLPREVRHMDPQHRLLLEVAWEALEDAGLPRRCVRGTRASVFVGIQWNDFLRLLCKDWSKLDGYACLGNLFAFAASRISYCFDLRGPSLAVDCGCASTIAAMQLACHSLWNRESDIALVGGVELMLSPDTFVLMSASGLLSRKGRCQTLGAEADGFVRGEGAGVIVLKPVSSLSAQDRPYAILRATAVNHNGRNEWIMAASQPAERAVIQQCCRSAGVTPRDLDYVELHGTGSSRGDQVEIQALAELIRDRRQRSHHCFIGSVKTILGHLGAASGIASVIKVALALHHREIPPMVIPERIHPAIDLSRSGLALPEKLMPWPKKRGLPLAGVTALSLSGVNAHAILAAPPGNRARRIYPQKRACRSSGDKPFLLPLSADSVGRLKKLVHVYLEFLGDGGTSLAVEDVCFTAGARRDHYPFRIAVVGSSGAELEHRLKLEIVKLESGRGGFPDSVHPKLVWIFPETPVKTYTDNQNSWLQKEPAAQELLEQWRGILRERFGVNSLLQENQNQSKVSGIVKGFIDQVILAVLLREWGIRPEALAGLGTGAVAAAYIAGQMDLKRALSTIEKPGKDDTAGELFLRDDSGYKSSGNFLQQDEMYRLLGHSEYVFLEFGPTVTIRQRTLSRNCPSHSESPCDLSRTCKELDRALALNILGELYKFGYDVDWDAHYAGSCRITWLPTYPWQRERLWPDWLDDSMVATPPERERKSRIFTAQSHPLLGAHTRLAFPPNSHFWPFLLPEEIQQMFLHHQLGGRPVLPDSAYLEMALTMAQQALGFNSCELDDLIFHAPCFLDTASQSEMQLFLMVGENQQATVKALSRARSEQNGSAPWKTHFSCTVRSPRPAQADPPKITAPQSRLSHSRTVSRDEFYEALNLRGWNADPAMRAVQKLRYGPASFSAEIDGTLDGAQVFRDFRLQPILLQSCMHAPLAVLPESSRMNIVALLRGIKRFRWFDQRVVSGLCRFEPCREFSADFNPSEWDLCVEDEEGRIVLEAQRLHYRQMPVSEFLSSPGPGDVDPSEAPTLHQLRRARGPERQSLLQRYVRNQVIEVLGKGPNVLIDEHCPLTQLGMDSLLAYELKCHLERDLHLSVPVSQLLGSGSVENISGHLASQFVSDFPSAMQPQPGEKGPESESSEEVFRI